MPTLLGSGMASQGAGVGPCGHDPEDEPSAVVTQTPVAALYFDPFQRRYVQNPDLSMWKGAGPIQRAAHLLLPLGSLPATASSGLDVQSIRRAPPARRQRAVEDAVRIAWKPLTQSRQIVMGKVTLDPSAPWNGKFTVEVTDLVTKQPVRLEGNT